MNALPIVGGCLCGAVRFKATCKPNWVGICHCPTCRKAMGGVVAGAAGYPIRAVTFSRESLQVYESSRGVQRTFCSVCGASISYQNKKWGDDIHILIGAHDKPSTLKRQFHLFGRHKLCWLHFHDKLPVYRTTPSLDDPMDINEHPDGV